MLVCVKTFLFVLVHSKSKCFSDQLDMVMNSNSNHTLSLGLLMDHLSLKMITNIFVFLILVTFPLDVLSTCKQG